ncbi:MAG: cell division protein ZapA [Pseudomonadota bacterium]
MAEHTDKETVAVTILDKEYLVASPGDARGELERSARYLDDKMREIRASGRVFGTERIAVMAALNITHELLQSSGDMPESAQRTLRDIDQRVKEALEQQQTGTES